MHIRTVAAAIASFSIAVSARPDQDTNPTQGLRSWLASAQTVLADGFNSVSTTIMDSLSSSSDKISLTLGAGVGRAGRKSRPEPISVANFTIENWKDALIAPALAKPGDTIEWLVMMTGGEKSCHGKCGNVTKAWQESLPFFSALTEPPHLGLIDCDAESDLCMSWGAGPAGVWHFLVTIDPTELAEGMAGPPHLARFPAFHSTIRLMNLPIATTTKHDITRILAHQTWKHTPVLSSWLFHPFDGFVARHRLEDVAIQAQKALENPMSMIVILVGSKLLFTLIFRGGQPSQARQIR